MRVCDAATGENRVPWKLAGGATGTVAALAWSRDSQLLAASTDTSAHLWDVANRKEVAVTNAPKNNFSALALGPDKGTVLVAGRWRANDVWVWDYTADRETRQLAKQDAKVAGLVLRGSTLITTSLDATNQGFKLVAHGWDVANGQHLWTATSETDAPNVNAHQCATSPDGKRVAIAVMERTDAGAVWRVDLHDVPPRK